MSDRCIHVEEDVCVKVLAKVFYVWGRHSQANYVSCKRTGPSCSKHSKLKELVKRSFC